MPSDIDVSAVAAVDRIGCVLLWRVNDVDDGVGLVLDRKPIIDEPVIDEELRRATSDLDRFVWNLRDHRQFVGRSWQEKGEYNWQA